MDTFICVASFQEIISDDLEDGLSCWLFLKVDTLILHDPNHNFRNTSDYAPFQNIFSHDPYGNVRKTSDVFPFQKKINDDLENELALRFCFKVDTLILYDSNDMVNKNPRQRFI